MQILGGLRGPSAVCAFQPILIRTFTPHGQTLNRFKEVLDGVVCLVKIHVIFTLLFAARWNHFRACSQQGSHDSAAHVMSLVGNSRFALLARSECVGALQVVRLPWRKVKASGERGFLKRKRESGAQSGSARCSGHLVLPRRCCWCARTMANQSAPAHWRGPGPIPERYVAKPLSGSNVNAEEKSRRKSSKRHVRSRRGKSAWRQQTVCRLKRVCQREWLGGAANLQSVSIGHP